MLVGYAAIHRVDLATMTSRVLLTDGRTERRGLISADGSRAVVFDGYGPTLHVFGLRNDSVESQSGSKKGLRQRFKAIGRRCVRSADGSATLKGSRPVLDGRPLVLPTGGFKSVRAITRSADGRVFVGGMVRTDPRADGPRMTLCVFDGAGDFLGSLALVRRRSPATRVFLSGRQATTESLAKAGITVNRARSSEANRALSRFVPNSDAGPGEVVFGRLANGLLGRLDTVEPIGDAAFEHEQPERICPGLLGRPSPQDAITDAAEDAAERLAFWGSAVDAAADIERAVEASAGVTHLLPEMQRRLTNLKRKAWRRRLERVATDLRAQRGAEADRVFEGMCARLVFEAEAARFAQRLAVPVEAVLDVLDGDDARLAPFRAAVEGEAHLSLPAAPDTSALFGLAAGGLAHLESLAFAGAQWTDDALQPLLERAWPALRRLDLRQTRISDATALALAAHDGLLALTALDLPESVSPIGRAAVHFSPTLAVDIPGIEPAALPVLLLHPGLDALQRQRILRNMTGGNANGVRIEPAALGGVDAAALLACLELDALGPDAFDHLELVGVAVDAALLAAIEAALQVDGLTLRLVDATIDRRAAVGLARFEWVERVRIVGGTIDPLGDMLIAWVFKRPVSAPPEDPAAILAGFLADDQAWDPADWTRLVDCARRHHPAAVEAAMATHSEAVARRLEGEVSLVSGGALWREAGWHTAIARLFCARHAAAPSDVIQRAPPLEFAVVDDGWTLWGKGAARFSLKPEPRLATVTRVFTGQDVLTGDDAFDAIARIDGDPAIIVPALDPSARDHLARALDAGVTYAEGAFSGPWPIAPADLGPLVGLLLQWRRGEAGIDAAVQRMDDEREGAVRARLLPLLLARTTLTAERRLQILERYALDPHEGVRAVAAEAIWPLVRRTYPTRLSAPLLAAVLGRWTDAALLNAIEHLGAIGDERCLPALTAVGSGLFVGRARRAAVQAATEAITTRIGGLRSGGLSISAGADGTLALSDPDALPEAD